MFDSNIQLLLACANPAASPARGGKIRELLRAQIEWPRLLEQANWHCVSPLLYVVLRVEAAELVPAEVLDTLRARGMN